MNQAISLGLVALLSGIGTLFLLNHRQQEIDRLAHSRSLAEYRRGPLKKSYLPLSTIPGPFPRKNQQYPHSHPLTAYTKSKRQSVQQGLSWFRMSWRERSAKSCYADPLSCGEGFYCCQGTCIPAVTGQIEFAGDDRADLYICGQLVRSTDSFGQKATYDGPIPCTDVYVKATNYKYEGGASIVMRFGSQHFSSGPGNSLGEKSQVNFQGEFKEPCSFKAIEGSYPYNEFIQQWGAYPVTDCENSSGEVINFRFKPTIC